MRNFAKTLLVLGLFVRTLTVEARSDQGEPWLQPDSAGVRYGVGGSSASRFFHQVEATGTAALPLHWEPTSDVFFHTALEVTAGWLTDRSRDGFIGSFGPVARLGWGKVPGFLECGLSVTLLSETEFQNKDFGTPLQFTSHVGFGLDLTKHWRVGYRYQHMSNCHLARPNPGLNLHGVSVSYVWK